MRHFLLSFLLAHSGLVGKSGLSAGSVEERPELELVCSADVSVLDEASGHIARTKCDCFSLVFPRWLYYMYWAQSSAEPPTDVSDVDFRGHSGPGQSQIVQLLPYWIVCTYKTQTSGGNLPATPISSAQSAPILYLAGGVIIWLVRRAPVPPVNAGIGNAPSPLGHAVLVLSTQNVLVMESELTISDGPRPATHLHPSQPIPTSHLVAECHMRNERDYTFRIRTWQCGNQTANA